jgi:hypothetical protein
VTRISSVSEVYDGSIVWPAVLVVPTDQFGLLLQVPDHVLDPPGVTCAQRTSVGVVTQPLGSIAQPCVHRRQVDPLAAPGIQLLCELLLDIEQYVRHTVVPDLCAIQPAERVPSALRAPVRLGSVQEVSDRHEVIVPRNPLIITARMSAKWRVTFPLDPRISISGVDLHVSQEANRKSEGTFSMPPGVRRPKWLEVYVSVGYERSPDSPRNKRA